MSLFRISDDSVIIDFHEFSEIFPENSKSWIMRAEINCIFISIRFWQSNISKWVGDLKTFGKNLVASHRFHWILPLADRFLFSISFPFCSAILDFFRDNLLELMLLETKLEFYFLEDRDLTKSLLLEICLKLKRFHFQYPVFNRFLTRIMCTGEVFFQTLNRKWY